MTVLQALDRYYDRMAARGEAEAPGFSREKISFAIVLFEDGDVVDVADLRTSSGRKRQPVLREVPAAVKRTVAVTPFRLWDKTAYVLGRTAPAKDPAQQDKEDRRTAQEHEAFKALHRDLLAGHDDAGLVALRRFLDGWVPARFDEPPFRPEMLDTNVVFRLAGDGGLIHEREAARRLIEARSGAEGRAEEVCLVTGRSAASARLHPTIKNVNGAQSSGAALVSFNLDAFTSYGKEQGANAPTSEAAAFRYGAALNRMLDRGGDNRLRRGIGDATVVFWADTSGIVDERQAASAEAAFSFFLEPEGPADEASDDDQQEAAKLRAALETISEVRAVEELGLGLVAGTTIHVLGLAPNAARLSVRYWLTDSIDAFARRLGAHYEDLRIAPRPPAWGAAQPAVGRLLVRTTALQEKFENIPPLLAGEVARAVLEGLPYPRAWLAAAIIRLRAGDNPRGGWHAAAIKACLNRPLRLEIERLTQAGADPDRIARLTKEMLPVALDPQRENDQAYHLGRLFAVLESAQYAALGKVNAPIGDRYYAAASATPARVFGALLRGLKNHIADARKRGQGGWIEPKVAEIVAKLPPDLPRTLKLEEQGRFAIGYYHERATRPEKKPDAEPAGE